MPAPGVPPPSAAWLELPDQGPYPLGRDTYFGRVAGNEIVVTDHRVSRRHAVVQGRGDGYHVVDLGSTNGTFVNDTRIHRPTQLRDADVIVISGHRFVFCQPATGGDHEVEAVAGTAVAVGKTACWMLVAGVTEPAGEAALEWAARAQESLVRSGAVVKRLRGASFLAHWRVEAKPPAVVRGAIEDLARQTLPSGVRLALHYGSVRASAGAAPTEENLLGAEVTLAHQLPAAAEALGVNFLLSEAAVTSLDLAKTAVPLGARAVAGAPGTHVLFELRPR